MTRIYLLLVLTITSITTFAQSDKIYHNLKYGMFMEYGRAPASLMSTSEYNDGNGNITTDSTYGAQTAGYSLFNVVYTFRINVYDVSDDFGIGVNIAPDLNFSISENGLGSINIPAFVTLNFGSGATYNSAGDFGGYVGVGYEYNKFNLLSLDFLDAADIELHEESISSWSQPMVIAGVRWWGASEDLQEVSIKYGFGSKSTDVPASVENKAPYTFQISYGRMLNY